MRTVPGPARVITLLCAVAWPGLAAAGEQPLICFGNEPFWSVDLTEPGVARFATPDEGPVVYNGVATRHAFLKETLWRGTPAEAGRDLVVWLQDAACSDGMSDTRHPVTARASLPDGRFLAGCCRLAAAAATTGDAGDLGGSAWQLVELPGSTPAALAALSRPVAVRFAAGRVSGFSGCNQFTGSYQREGDRLTLAEGASTMMACPEPAASIENAFQTAFAGALRYALEGDRLTLTSNSGAALRFERQPPPKLAGVEWKVTGYNNNRQAVVGVIGDPPITLSFKGGEVAGSAGCNSFRASYSVEGNGIRIGPAMTTRRACEEPLMVQEREFLAALVSAVTWSIDGNVLDMHRADGERAIWAIAQ